MQKKIFLPQLELSMENVAVTKWLVQPGERIKAEQPLLQIETEKAVMDVPSPESGYLRQHCVSEGDTISGRTMLCILTDSPDEPIEDGDVELSSNARDSTHAPLPSTATQEAPSVALDSAIRTAP